MAKWTSQENEHLLRLRAETPPASWHDCAKVFGRSAEAVRSHYRDISGSQRRRTEKSPGKAVYGIEINTFLSAIKDSPKTRDELSKQFDRSVDTIEEIVSTLQALSYEVVRTETEQIIWPTRATSGIEPPPTIWDQDYGEFIVGIISDIHFGSKWAQITNLRRCLEEMYQQDVRQVLFCGDLTAGDKVYRGQIHDLVTPSGLQQAALAVEYLPQYEGMTYYMLGGNHDFSFIKQNGYNVVRDVARQRDDVVYVGFDLADVPILPGIDARLWHPMGGVPYAYSYRIQKHVEEMAFAELQKVIERQHSPRVQMLFAGHLHIRLFFDAGPILCAQVPCFEGQTPYLRRKGKVPIQGGLILEFQMTKAGQIRQDWPRRSNFAEIPNDYLNYPVPVEEEPELEVLFEWIGEEG